MSGPLERLIDQIVVLDTDSPIVYIGTLTEITDRCLVLGDADMHDCREGHASKERYLVEAHAEGITTNRRQVIVMRSFVISVSRLSDVVD
ncbi:MAG: hypothetical protein ACE5E5_09330 [Phycisphaerae bacterium]